MPYRRLPNTDKARLEAMKIALEKQEQEVEPILPYKFRLQLSEIAQNFDKKLNFKHTTLLHAAQRSKQHAELVAKCRMYLSHFFQVVNMAILRGELPKRTRTYYGINELDNKLPNLNSESKLLHWGTQLINGEQERMSQGGIRINNPSLALVTINYEKFKDSLQSIEIQRNIQDRATNDVTNSRTTVDESIVELWNILEAYFNPKTKEGRESCTAWGINYIYRKSELERIERERYKESITLSLNLI